MSLLLPIITYSSNRVIHSMSVGLHCMRSSSKYLATNILISDNGLLGLWLVVPDYCCSAMTEEPIQGNCVIKKHLTGIRNQHDSTCELLLHGFGNALVNHPFAAARNGNFHSANNTPLPHKDKVLYQQCPGMLLTSYSSFEMDCKMLTL